MVIIGATKAEAEEALSKANEHFHGNLAFREITELPTRRDKRPALRITLTVKDTDEIGSRRAYVNHRRIAAACWHAHGTFFDALPAHAEIRVDMPERRTFRPGDKWQDSQFGNEHYGVRKASQLCNCMDWNTSGVLPFPVNV